VSSKLIRVLAATALAAACAAILGTAAFGRGRAHADLRIVRRSVKRAGGTRARPVFSGSFTVTNVGNTTAHAFHGWVELTAAKKRLKIMSRYTAGPLKAGRRRSLKAKVKMPQGLAKVHWTIEACVVLGKSLKTKPAKDGCHKLATYDLTPPKPGAKAPPTTSGTTSPTHTTPGTTTTAPPPQVPTSPITNYSTNSPYFVADGIGQYDGYANAAGTNAADYNDDASGGFFTSGYWVVVPPSYDASNQTPETLVVWMHGCGGAGAWDAQDLTGQFNTDRPYIDISLNGPENANAAPDHAPDCWDTHDDADVQKVLTDITNVETHFNIDRRRVILAGYSSGGDLAYQTIFEHADTFAGVLALNTDPVHDNTFHNDISSAIAAAAWKFPIVQVAHVSDSTYPPSEVGPHMNALTNAGFGVSYGVLPGTHYDDDQPANCNDTTPGTCTSGTPYDIAHHLLNTVASDGWEAPQS
jgi:predicted esterase